MTFIPHTLEEQKALLTAEAEGKVVKVAPRSSAQGWTKVIGVWSFDACRYEVEQPLMEEWVIVDKNGLRWTGRDTEEEAMAYVGEGTAARAYRNYTPFRVVHMKEVR